MDQAACIYVLVSEMKYSCLERYADCSLLVHISLTQNWGPLELALQQPAPPRQPFSTHGMYIKPSGWCTLCHTSLQQIHQLPVGNGEEGRDYVRLGVYLHLTVLKVRIIKLVLIHAAAYVILSHTSLARKPACIQCDVAVTKNGQSRATANW